MSINFQQVYEQIRAIGQTTAAHQEHLTKVRQQALDLLHQYAREKESLHAKIDRAAAFDPTLRCALPLTDEVDAQHPPPQTSEPLILIAADGSQIAPDRHAQALYSLLNIGAICLETSSGHPPQICIESTLLYDEELYDDDALVNEEALEQQRDLGERRKLLELAKELQGKADKAMPILALTEGPLELWGIKGTNKEYQQNLEAYLALLVQFQERGIIIAGYVDKPGANLLVRLLEIAALDEAAMSEVRSYRPLRGVTDRWLVSQFLPAGHRSAIFGLQSVSRARYPEALAVCFFYLNVGDAQHHPHLARVEVPRWIAEDPIKLDRLHAALLEQCRLMGNRPYPYLLHRAHETAVVKLEEKHQIEQMLILELRRAGGEVEEVSYKQSAKDLPRH